MATGSDALDSAYAKLRWAEKHLDDMQQSFAAFALPEDPDARPYGIRFHVRSRPTGLIVARFIVEKRLPADMSLLAADLVHNTRVALDHTLARLKDRFGGNAGRGSFPVCVTDGDWKRRVEDAGRASPLHGLDETVIDFIRKVQPMYRRDPENDPLVLLNGLDNDDKHRLLRRSFVYPGATERTGLDLIHIARPSRVLHARNSWAAGQPLEHGTKLATFIVRDPEEGILQARSDAEIGFAIGDLGIGRTRFTSMIDRVREIADGAARLIGGDD